MDMNFVVANTHKQQQHPNAAPAEEKGHGSANLKHQRSDDTWGTGLLKMQKPADLPSRKTTESNFSAFGRSNLWPDDGQSHKMLSFSSSDMPGAATASTRSITFSLAQDEHDKRALNEGIRGPFARMRGPFTPSQWMELEHQALIYKYLVANVPVPSHLLVPLRRSLSSYGSPASFAPNFLGWGPFHLGYSGSNDPEPGRCRRTDGKKWRCSRDAVPDQKYCERHINRGRHRSRKPVEGHTGHAVAGSTASKVAPIAPPSSASVIPSSGTSNTVSAMQQQHFTSMQHNAAAVASADNLVSRSQGLQGLSLLPPPTIGLKSKDAASYSIQKQHLPFEELSNSEFGLVMSDSLLNPTERIPYIDNSGSLLQFNAKDANNQHPVHQFFDNWPKDQSHRPSGPWQDELKPDWTQLSMSIPVASDFSSSSSSPAQEKSTIPIPRLTHEMDLTPIHMSLGTGTDVGIKNQSPWLPIPWATYTMGGPLGEVLISKTPGAESGEIISYMKTTPPLKSSSPQMGLSPSGVLPKSNVVSLSNSSSANSPTSADNKSAAEKARLCNGFLGAVLNSSSAIQLP